MNNTKVRFADEVQVAEISCRSSTDISKESFMRGSFSPRKLISDENNQS